MKPLVCAFILVFCLSPAVGYGAKGKKMETATLAGGCFWCVEADLEKIPGVQSVISGYSGGTEANPTYKQVASGNTGHREVVRVIFDPKQITYGQLLHHFWRVIDPTDSTGSFVDRGMQYASAIFYHNKEQKQIAEASKKALEASRRYDKPITTPIIALLSFHKAEDYHQDYYKKHPLRYKYYRYRSGRDQYLKKIWGEKKNASK